MTMQYIKNFIICEVMDPDRYSGSRLLLGNKLHHEV